MTDLELTPSQRELLLSIPERFDLARIDRIWVFPAYSRDSRETGLFAVSLVPDAVELTTQRILMTLRYDAEVVRGRIRRSESLSEEGRANPERLDLVISGVLARAGDEFNDPLLASIEGDPTQWSALLDRFDLPT